MQVLRQRDGLTILIKILIYLPYFQGEIISETLQTHLTIGSIFCTVQMAPNFFFQFSFGLFHMDQFHSKNFALIKVPSPDSDKNDTGNETWPDQPFIYKQEI